MLFAEFVGLILHVSLFREVLQGNFGRNVRFVTKIDVNEKETRLEIKLSNEL